MAKRKKSKYPEIEKLYDSLLYAKTSWEVWEDIVQLFAISFSNALDVGERRDKREKEYLRIQAKYSEKEMITIANILALIVGLYEENPDQDVLGEIYMALGLGSSELGQFFTPYNVCKMMAKMVVGNKEFNENEIAKRGYVSVNEPACGAGATIIALLNAYREMGINYQTDVFVMAQDLSYITALMCYIQLSLLGCAAVIVVGDTICNPPTTAQTIWETAGNMWFTPMYQSELWRARREAKLLAESLHIMGAQIAREKPTEEKKVIPKPAPEPPKEENNKVLVAEQLSLF